MTRIESNEVNVACSAEECYSFLSDMNNYELLLPKDKISNWAATEKECSFKIQKTYKLELKHVSGEPNSKIELASGASSPFKFTLNVFLTENGESTNAKLICDADINPFLKMMVEKPLNNLFNYMADRLVKVKSA